MGIWIPLRERRSERAAVALDAVVGTGGTAGFDVEVRDLAPHGFAADLANGLPVGTMVWLLLPRTAGLNARVVRRDGARHGFEFLVPIAPALCASLVAAEQAQAA